MKNPYHITTDVIFCLLLVLLPASFFIAWAAIQDNLSSGVKGGLEGFLSFVLRFPVLVIFTGILHTLFAQQQKLDIFAAWLLAIIVSVIAVYFFFGFVENCSVTSEILAELKKSLS